MGNNPSSKEVGIVSIEIAPMEGEGHDLDTLAVIEQTYIDMRNEAYQLEGYIVRSSSMTRSGADALILISSAIVTGIAANKDILIALVNTLAKAIELLASRERVQEIEIRTNGRSIILKNARKRDAEELIESAKAFIGGEQLSESKKGINPASMVEVEARVSNRNTTEQ